MKFELSKTLPNKVSSLGKSFLVFCYYGPPLSLQLTTVHHFSGLGYREVAYFSQNDTPASHGSNFCSSSLAFPKIEPSSFE